MLDGNLKMKPNMNQRVRGDEDGMAVSRVHLRFAWTGYSLRHILTVKNVYIILATYSVHTAALPQVHYLNVSRVPHTSFPVLANVLFLAPMISSVRASKHTERNCDHVIVPASPFNKRATLCCVLAPYFEMFAA